MNKIKIKTKQSVHGFTWNLYQRWVLAQSRDDFSFVGDADRSSLSFRGQDYQAMIMFLVKKHPPCNLCLQQRPPTTVSHNSSAWKTTPPREILVLAEVFALWLLSSCLFVCQYVQYFSHYDKCLNKIIWYDMIWYVMLWYVMLCYVMLCYIML